MESLWFMPACCCKRGVSGGPHPISVGYDSPDRNGRWEAEFKRRYSDKYLKEAPFFSYIYKSYKEVFNEPWVFDHMEYWYEITFHVYMGKLTEEKYFDPKLWGAYGGPHGGGNSFEEMLINAAKDVKRCYGNFKSQDFVTEEEKKNNKSEQPFFFKPSKNKHKNIVGEEESCSIIVDNPKYISVNPHVINRRWLEWYTKTPSCKKDWKDEFDPLLKNGKYPKSYVHFENKR
jgi:hypothetical protein